MNVWAERPPLFSISNFHSNSGGFAFVHADSTADICATEAVKLGDLDSDAVRAGLAEYTAKLATVQSKGDDYEIAAAQVGVEVYSAMNAALGQ
jgi:F-type H+-transporting ATPase subunit delta